MPRLTTIVLLWLCANMLATAQTVPNHFYKEMQYRMIGPFRAGRTVGATGVPSQPNVFYIGVNNGGVWKTDDYGRTWRPIFDSAPTGSVGDIAVSPTQPNIIYVGTGEGLHRPDLSVGDGVFKSLDGGATWSHIGLSDVQQIGGIRVHPTNPNVVFVAALGHPYGPNEQRGVYRSLDGGRNWEKVLYINHNSGAIQVEIDPNNPKIIYADMWEHREGPWENAGFAGTNSGLYKSTDGGARWKRVGKGLPGASEGLGRIGFCIAPSNSKWLYATVDARKNGGIYQSKDGGENWTLVTGDRRLWGRGSDFAEIKVHPKNPNTLFIGNVAAYRSDDGGKTWSCNKGAPGGDDYHRIWINPKYPDIMLYAADQGAVITVNGGKTWGSWYNQPTAQLYHVSTDYQFPYQVYGGQQESGAIAVSSRGNGGQISFRDWMGVGADEYAYVAPDPLNPDIIYGGRVVRFNKKTGQTQSVAPEAIRSGQYRILRTMPLLFHPADPHTLFFATNVLWKTNSGGQQWEIISPDLSREQPDVPESIGDFRTPELNTMSRRGVIYAVAPSPVDVNTIWAGTDDGLVHITTDGGLNWANITPGEMRSWDKVSQLDASHFDRKTAYMAVNAIRRSDMRPHIYKTRDGGATWTHITRGMPDNGPVNVVREDPRQPGLLFAGTEREVYFSIDDGEHWQSLRNNMPASSIRDLVIKDDDLVIGTHGRSIWILDNIAPLREMARAMAASKIYLFQPPLATRVRWNMFSDTPLPPEEPTGQNPPDGVIFDYYLNKPVKTLVIEVLDSKGGLVRRFTNTDLPELIDSTQVQYPMYWIKPWHALSVEAGHHRINWDLRYAPPKGSERELSIAAVFKSTPTGPHGPYVHPGQYTVRMIADGDKMEQSFHVRLDPRVVIGEADLQLQTDLSMQCYSAYHDIQAAREAVDQQLSAANISAERREALKSLRGEGDPGSPDFIYGSIYSASPEKETLVGLQYKFLHTLLVLQSADARPTNQTIESVTTLKDIWGKLKQRL